MALSTKPQLYIESVPAGMDHVQPRRRERPNSGVIHMANKDNKDNKDKPVEIDARVQKMLESREAARKETAARPALLRQARIFRNNSWPARWTPRRLREPGSFLLPFRPSRQSRHRLTWHRNHLREQSPLGKPSRPRCRRRDQGPRRVRGFPRTAENPIPRPGALIRADGS